MAYLRFQSAVPNPDGRYPGVFGLINGLSREGKLTPEEEEFRRVNNAWYEANFIDPSSAHAFVDRIDGYRGHPSRKGIDQPRRVRKHRVT